MVFERVKIAAAVAPRRSGSGPGGGERTKAVRDPPGRARRAKAQLLEQVDQLRQQIQGNVEQEQAKTKEIDWIQQEFGIAAALSGDPAMIMAYQSGDSYLWFAKESGEVPPDATRETHGAKREQFKQCVLGTQYGIGPEALADRIGQSTKMGRHLLRLHRETFPRYWEWVDGACGCGAHRRNDSADIILGQARS